MPGFFVGPAGPGSIEKKTGGIVETWYNAFNNQDYNALLSLFPDELYQKVSREQMKGIFVSYRTKLGALKTKKVHFAKENHSNGASDYVLQYAASYEHSESHDTFTINQKSPDAPVKLLKVEFSGPRLS